MDQAAEYAASNIKVCHDGQALIEEFSEEFRSMNGRIIDIGCGPGDITEDLLYPNVGKDAVIVGADISANMIKYAEKHHTIKDKLSYLQLDIETPELPESLLAQFDNAVSFYCLHWCKNMKAPMDNFYKLLRPGGKAIISLISHHPIFDIYLEQQKDPKFSAYMQDLLEFTYPHHGQKNPEEMMRIDLEEAGFKVLHCSNKWKTYNYPSLDVFLDLMMSVHPFFKRMPENLQKHYRKDMERRLVEKYQCNKTNGNSNNCTFDWRMAMLTAVFEKPRN